MEDRELRWKMRRCGKVTGSGLKELMTKGKKGASWGDTSINYLYKKKYELRTGKPIRSETNKNFKFGHEHEPMAIEWLRANTMYDIKHCSSVVDFPDDIYFVDNIIGDLGDSPDALIDNDAIGECKCLVSQAKFEAMRTMTKADVVGEYYEQFGDHLLSHPDRTKLIYWVYDAQVDEDELDNIDPLHPSRGIIFEYSRDEFEGLMEEIKERVKIGMSAVRESLRSGEKLEVILNGK